MSTLLPIFGPQAVTRGQVTAYQLQPKITITKAQWASRVPVGSIRQILAAQCSISNMPSSGVTLYIYFRNSDASPDKIFYSSTNMYDANGMHHIPYNKDIYNDDEWHIVGKVNTSSSQIMCQHFAKFYTPGTYYLEVGYSVTPALSIVPRRPMAYMTIPIHVPEKLKQYVLPVAIGVITGALGLYIIEKVRKRI